jgi:glycerate kinase
VRVLVAPDKFAGTLGAPEAARAIADGWTRAAPHDEVTRLPMADGGPGFVDALHDALGGRLHGVTVRGSTGVDVPVTLLQVDDAVYLESAQACGLQLGAPTARTASTWGVGEAVRAALDLGPATVVVGLGGSATNDGGAGLLGALGAAADRPLDAGPDGLRGVTRVDLAAARALVGDVRLVAASDVDVPLLGMFGATKTFGPQKGLDDADVLEVDGLLDGWVQAACGPTPAERRVADSPGAGAAGGLGLALLLLGAERRPGVDVVAEAVGLDAACAAADLVVSGEGSYDHTSRSGKVVHGVAQVAARHARPCVAVAGQVTVGAREMRAMGVESAYAMVDLVGPERSFTDPAGALADVAERVARTWSRPVA